MIDFKNDVAAHTDWTCNKCKKKIGVAFFIRLCNKCFDEYEEETAKIKEANGARVLSDEEFAEIFLAPKEKQN